VSARPLVPDDFAVPDGLMTARFHLVPLGPEHNDADHAAWTSSIAHIRATPGFERRPWPPEQGMSLAENLADLEQHAREFAARTGFTYTVLSPQSGEVLGCVYLEPARDEEHDVSVRSWVRASVAELDGALHETVLAWLAADWPFARVSYAPRDPRSGRDAPGGAPA
jgi:hypothetical protein